MIQFTRSFFKIVFKMIKVVYKKYLDTEKDGHTIIPYP